MLLNTSFNNNAEPIVQTVADAMVCYLTSGLDHLVVGDFIATKTAAPAADVLRLKASLPVAAQLIRTRRHVGPRQEQVTHHIAWNYEAGRRVDISPALHALLADCDGTRPLAAAAAQLGIATGPELVEEVWRAWSERVVVLSP